MISKCVSVNGWLSSATAVLYLYVNLNRSWMNLVLVLEHSLENVPRKGCIFGFIVHSFLLWHNPQDPKNLHNLKFLFYSESPVQFYPLPVLSIWPIVPSRPTFMLLFFILPPYNVTMHPLQAGRDKFDSFRDSRRYNQKRN